ncbi:2-oxo-4-hydroxy-4-carboxy-5-ureidoimidazoline decarboxylase [Marinicella meishanensis]|uniref:2-oxo-4-hydroxy-4-carboxy-5-ureidoimidazoline decarboxylase n=1 Tax=Marinicella meishanensis TaxID=2873263 RepID=UPI001CBB61D3|nr:2-oxo-4-hydroxy-4-carboxy-5-ureidoimidazoline decarboxylase [Marinicella sp. NBU2979]
MSLAAFNQMHGAALATALERCCGASRWVAAMVAAHPFASVAAVHQSSDEIWSAMGEPDYREAFSHHPMIGDLAALRERFADTAAWAGQEQSGSQQADEATLLALQQGNHDYLAKFGHIFIVCATGKSAAEMLALLQQRLPNDAATELATAAAEQNKITHLRLDKMLGLASGPESSL